MPDAEAQAAITAELAKLRALLKAREGQPGYAANVAAIKARIAVLEAQSG